MPPRLLGCALVAALAAGCADGPPLRPLASKDPTNPNAPESPISPPSTFLATGPTDDGAGGKSPAMSGMQSGADDMDMQGMDMKGMDMGGMKMSEMKRATKSATTQQEPGK